jgi:DNA-binding FadR family transcriptional regulator
MGSRTEANMPAMPSPAPSAAARRALEIANRIHDDLLSQPWPTGTIYGTEDSLRQRFGTGRESFREALRILEFRGVGRMRSGPGGGFMAELPRLDVATIAIVGYLRMCRVSQEQVNAAADCLASSLPSPDLSPAAPWQEMHAMALRLLVGAVPASGAQLSREWFLSGDFPLNRSHAGGLVRSIVTDLYKLDCPAGHRIGSEADLCERYRAKRTTVREAVRVLEDAGIVALRRGRGMGLYACAPDPEPVIARMCAYAASRGVPPAGAWHLGSHFALAAAQHAAASITSEHRATLQHLAGALHQSPPQSVRQMLNVDGAIRAQAGNPILDLFCRAAMTYALAGHVDFEARVVTPEHPSRFLATCFPLIAAISQGDVAEAAQAQHGKNELFSSRLMLLPELPGPWHARHFHQARH